jgi:hypothetical protein
VFSIVEPPAVVRTIALSQLAHESDGRFLGSGKRGQHAGTGIDQQRDGERDIATPEVRERLRLAVFEHDEVVLRQVADVLVLRIGDGHAQRDQLGGGSEGLLRTRHSIAGHDQHGHDCRKQDTHRDILPLLR